MKELLILLAIGAAAILIFFWNEGDPECQPQDEYDYCEQEREDSQF